MPGGEVGDALGLDLGDLARRAGAVVGGVEQDVGELVGEGLDRLGGGQVGPDADGAGAVVGLPVGVGAAVCGAALEPVAAVLDEVDELVPGVGGGVAAEAGDVGGLGELVAVGLGEVDTLVVRKPRSAVVRRDRPGAAGCSGVSSWSSGRR